MSFATHGGSTKAPLLGVSRGEAGLPAGSPLAALACASMPDAPMEDTLVVALTGLTACTAMNMSNTTRIPSRNAVSFIELSCSGRLQKPYQRIFSEIRMILCHR